MAIDSRQDSPNRPMVTGSPVDADARRGVPAAGHPYTYHPGRSAFRAPRVRHGHLRFDCFENEPHYHYIEQAAGANIVVRIDELAVGDPVDFSLACVEHHLADMLRNCGVADLADEVAEQHDEVKAVVAWT